MSLQTNLVAYYKLDGNSTESVSANNGSDTSVTYSSGNGKIVQGAGFTFASSSKISISNAIGLSSSSKSISCWFKTSDVTNEQYLLSGSIGSGNTYLSLLRLNPGTISFIEFDNLGSSSVTTTGSYNDGNWHHVVVTVSSGTGVIIYVDGTSVKTQTITARTISGLTKAAIGCRSWDGEIAGFSNMAVDEIGVWSRVLSSGEVTSLYNGGAGFPYPLISFITLSITTGSFALNGQSINMNRILRLVCSYGSFALTGFSAVLQRVKTLIISTGFFSLTGNSVTMRIRRNPQNSAKHDSTVSNASKHNSIVTNISKS